MKSAPRTARVEISALVFKEGDHWVAQCVEHDIVAHAQDPGALPKAIEKAVLINICVNAEFGRIGLDGIPAAPEKFRAIFDDAKLDLKPLTKNDKEDRVRGKVRIRSMRLVTALAA